MQRDELATYNADAIIVGGGVAGLTAALKLAPHAMRLGVLLAGVGFVRLDAEQLIGGGAQRFGERDHGRGWRVTSVILVVGDGALGAVDGFRVYVDR